MKIKARGSWASYQDKKDKTVWRCDLDEMCEQIVKEGWGSIPRFLSDKKAMELFILAEAYLRYRDKDKMKIPRKKS